MILLTLNYFSLLVVHFYNHKQLFSTCIIMKTYSKKASKRTERAERSSSSDDEWAGKERIDPRKISKRPVHHQKMMKVTKEEAKRVKLIKINRPILRRRLRHKKENGVKGRFSSKSVDFFTNILLIEIIIASIRVQRKGSSRQ